MHTDDNQTVNAVLHGDKDSYEKLVDKYKKMVYSIAWSHLGDPDLSEDAAQETFVKAYTYLGTLREPGKFAGWLARIARNVCGSLGRRMKREKAFLKKWAVLEPTEVRPEEDGRESLSMQLWDSFAKLPAIHREALTLFYVEGKSITEASAVLGIGEQAMRTRLHRARTALRAQLEQMLEESLSELQPSKGFTQSVIALLPFAPKGMAGAGLLAVFGKLSASILFALWMTTVSALPIWALYSLLGRVEESSLEDTPQNETARAMIRRDYRKLVIIIIVSMVVVLTAFRLLVRSSSDMMAAWQIGAVFCGCILLLAIIGASPQLLGHVRTPGILLNVLMWGVLFAAVAAIAFFKAPSITFFVAIFVICIINYFADPQTPLPGNLFLRQAMGMTRSPDMDIRFSREVSRLEMRTFARLLADMRLVRGYCFEGDAIRLLLFSMQRNPLVAFGVVPSGSQITIRPNWECTAIMSDADLRIISQMAGPSISKDESEEHACNIMKYALNCFAEGRIQEMHDILSPSPDRSSPQSRISARSHKIKWLIFIWLGIVMIAALRLAPSAKDKELHHWVGAYYALAVWAVGILVAIIALLITIHINKRQMSSTQD